MNKFKLRRNFLLARSAKVKEPLAVPSLHRLRAVPKIFRKEIIHHSSVMNNHGLLYALFQKGFYEEPSVYFL